MAVIPTGDIFKTLTLDGVSSRDYSVYITGEAVFNSPARDVEMITIPGRNGSFALDKGRFENIEVTYPAGIAADTEAEFREAISDFRNFLASRNGYVRLEDDYNPNEYRLAVYKSGLDVTPAQLRAGEFDITFDCKPQRYLKSGEDAISVDSGDVVSNPTLFASSPMLEVEGYGTIVIGNYSIQLNDIPLGDVIISRADLVGVDSISFDTSLLNIGDRIHLLGNDRFEFLYNIRVRSSIWGNPAIESESDCKCALTILGTNNCGVYIRPNTTEFVYGTPSAVNMSAQVWIPIHINDDQPSNARATLDITMSYDGDSTITFSVTPTFNYQAFFGTCKIESVTPITIYGESSQSALGNPTYIDCELGECYAVRDGQIVSLNRGVDLGSNLPTLAPGANTVTFDNTITDLQIIPRWWKL